MSVRSVRDRGQESIQPGQLGLERVAEASPGLGREFLQRRDVALDDSSARQCVVENRVGAYSFGLDQVRRELFRVGDQQLRAGFRVPPNLTGDGLRLG